MTQRLLTWFAVGMVVSVITGCKDGQPPMEVEPFQVTGTAPADLEVGVALETKVRFRVNTDIDPSGLDETAFTLFELDGPQVAGAIEIDDAPNIAVFTPDESLALITSYTATVTTRLTDVDGRALEEPQNWSFTTVDAGWGMSQLIDASARGPSALPQVGTDAEGNAFSVWQQSDGLVLNIFANRFTRIDTWGEAQRIGLPEGGDAGFPQLAVDPSGVAHAVWDQPDGEVSHVFTSRYTPSANAWSQPELIQTGGLTAASNPQIAVGANGNAVAVWIQSNAEGFGRLVWANTYTLGQGWGDAEPIEASSPALHGTGLDVAVDPNENAVAVWTRSDTGLDGDLWANRYTAGDGWGTAEIVGIEGLGDVEGPRVAIDSAGNAHAVWQLDDGTSEDVWTSRSTPNEGWEAPQQLADDPNSAGAPAIAAEASGTAHAVWWQSDGTFQNIWASRYTTGGGWDAPQLIEDPIEDPMEEGSADRPQIAVDPDGNVFVVWQQRDFARFNIWSNRYEPETGWETAELIEQETFFGSNPQIAVDPNRHAHAVWTQAVESQGTTQIAANRFE